MQRSFGAAPLAAVLVLAAGACAVAPETPAASTTAETVRKEIIRPEGASTVGPYSPGVRAGNLIFLSGAIGSRPGEGLVEGGIEAETRQALENLRNTLRAAGADMEDVAKCTVFLADIADFQAMNRVYREFFPQDPPARSTVATALVAGAKVEIECIAVAP